MIPLRKETLLAIAQGTGGTLLLFLAYVALPVFGMPGAFFAPFPAAYFGLRSGRVVGMASVAATAAVLTLFDPSVALLYLFQAGLISLALPEFLRRGMAGRGAIAATVAVVAGAAGIATAVYAGVKGTTIGRMIATFGDANVAQSVELYRKAGLTGEELANITAVLRQGWTIIGLTWPALMFIFLFSVTGITLMILKRSEERLPHLGQVAPFAAFRTPELLVWPLIAAGFALLVPEPVTKATALNVVIALLFLYFVQGLAIVGWLFRRFRISKMMRFILYVVLALQPYLAAVIVGIGLFDLWVNFRNPRNRENL